MHYSSDIGTLPDELSIPYKDMMLMDEWQRARLEEARKEWWRIAREGKHTRDNYVFEATMRFTGMSRGRSAAYFHLIDEAGHRYTMFMTDMVDMVQNALMIRSGQTRGCWTFQKRGNNFGVKLVH